jgi:polyphosphate kinase
MVDLAADHQKKVSPDSDEAPNIAWGRLVEQEHAHVSYGVENLKTHVKLAMVVREDEGCIALRRRRSPCA